MSHFMDLIVPIVFATLLLVAPVGIMLSFIFGEKKKP